METLTVKNFQRTLPQVLRTAKQHPVEVQAEDGTIFVFEMKQQKPTEKNTQTSPFDIAGIQIQANNFTENTVVDVIRDLRER